MDIPKLGSSVSKQINKLKGYDEYIKSLSS